MIQFAHLTITFLQRGCFSFSLNGVRDALQAISSMPNTSSTSQFHNSTPLHHSTIFRNSDFSPRYLADLVILVLWNASGIERLIWTSRSTSRASWFEFCTSSSAPIMPSETLQLSLHLRTWSCSNLLSLCCSPKHSPLPLPLPIPLHSPDPRAPPTNLRL